MLILVVQLRPNAVSIICGTVFRSFVLCVRACKSANGYCNDKEPDTSLFRFWFENMALKHQRQKCENNKNGGSNQKTKTAKTAKTANIAKHENYENRKKHKNHENCENGENRKNAKTAKTARTGKRRGD